MRCKACDAYHEREDDLCKKCATASFFTGQVWEQERDPPEQVPDGQYFMSMVYKFGLDKSWREGAGFMAPEARVRHMWDRALERYRQNREWGMGQYMAFAKATGLANRGNQRYVTKGTSNVKTTDGAQEGNTMSDGPDLGGETLSYEYLW